MKKTYIFANLFWAGLAVAVCIESLQLQIGSFHQPGPAFLPFLAAVLMGILSLVSLVQTLKGPLQDDYNPWAKMSFLKLGLVVASLFLYVLLLNTLGFLLDTFILLLFLFRVMEPYRWTKVLFASLLTIGAVYAFFVVLLDSRLPKGLLGF